MRVQDVLSWFVVVACFIVAVGFSARVPEVMAVHWNAEGVADGYSGKVVGLYLFPVIILGLWLLFLAIPKIAVYKKNIADFTPYYVNLRLLFILFLAGTYVVTLLWNLGYDFNIGHYIIPAMAILFYYIGHIMKFLKRNYFIGVKTPWTLSSDEVWDKTHLLASKIFRSAAVLMLLALFYPSKPFLFILPLIVGALYMIVYSYWIGRKVQL